MRVEHDERTRASLAAVAASSQVLRSLRAVRLARSAGVAPGLAPADLVLDLTAPRHLRPVR